MLAQVGNAVPEFPRNPLQLPLTAVPAIYEQQHVQQMSTFMAMAAADMAGTGGMTSRCTGPETGFPVPSVPTAGGANPTAFAAAAAASAYTQVLAKFSQHAEAVTNDTSAAAAALAAAFSPGLFLGVASQLASVTTSTNATAMQVLPAITAAIQTSMPNTRWPTIPPTQSPPLCGVVPPVAGTDSIISVSLEGMTCNYQLTDDDLQSVFERYGTVKQVRVEKQGTLAHIVFESMAPAQAAVNDLNGKVLSGLNGKLRIEWVCVGGSSNVASGVLRPAGHSSSISPAAPYPAISALPEFASWGAPQTWLSAPSLPVPLPPQAPTCSFGASLPQAHASISNVIHSNTAARAPAIPLLATPLLPAESNTHISRPLAELSTLSESSGAAPTSVDSASAPLRDVSGDPKPPPHVKGVRKYTCRFLIGIENDKDFHVVRRIIGANGSNMKHIFEQTDAKLRLRGRGSGYFEGAGHKESAEPLQLCVSCTSEDGYKLAVALAEALLENIYSEFRAFSRERGSQEPNLRARAQVVSGRERDAHRPSDVVTVLGLNSSVMNLAHFPVETDGDSSGSGLSFGADDSDDEDDLVAGAAKKDGGGRRRGRRSRAARSRGDYGKASTDKTKPPAKAPPVAEIDQLIDQRNEARRQCNFAEADRIRCDLHERGVALMDEPGARGKGMEVTTWRYWRD